MRYNPVRDAPVGLPTAAQMGKEAQMAKSHRSAVSGRYVTPGHAARHPSTTVSERRTKPASVPCTKPVKGGKTK